MKKLLIISLAAMAMTGAKAELLEPSVALQRALDEIPAGTARRSMRAQQFNQLKMVDLNSAEAELYVFGAPSGLMVVSAESETPALLGYSENYVEGSELPPSLVCMLNLYAKEIRALRAGDVIPATSAGSRADFSPIEPICKTTWNQDAPYNNSAPTMNGQRTYTGCVATAMAQVLKTYEHPDKCTGGYYSYKWQNGGKSLSMNFDNVTLKWDQMLDSYSGSSTSVQRLAVAGLMQAVGYAAQMNYGTEASGTQSLYCLAGVIRHFDYDYSAQFLMRDWFSLGDWQQKVYGELAAGRPVYYDGQNLKDQVGHAFVVDGYRSDGFFHLNWGWGGLLDGYFLLTALNPDGQQGIGGSGGGYSDGCGAVFNLTPGCTSKEEDAPLVLAIYGGDVVFSPTQSRLGRTETITFTNDGLLINNMPFEISDVYLGLKMTSAAGEVYYGSFSGPIDNLQTFYGYRQLSL
ncbi:MAG: C10 family peptidase, partial [Muribaculaceae bacterium]|nr:C10 family peptidase [Muribaculaceae bacterium]